MWKRAIFCLVGGAYVGGLASLLIIYAFDRTLEMPTLRGDILQGALGIMVFTLPGALIVAGVFERLTHRGVTPLIAYLVSVISGTIIGGGILTLIFGAFIFLAIGAISGLMTSVSWAFLHLLLLRSRRIIG